MNPWKEIHRKLKNDGFDVYSPGQKDGLCKEPYIVVRIGVQNSFAGVSGVGYRAIDIIIYIPIDQYSEIEGYSQNVRNSMKEIRWLRKTGAETPPIIDEEKKAHTMSIQYKILKKL